MESKTATGNRLAAQDLKAFCVAAMLKSGLKAEDAELTAEVLVTTDTWGTFTHGSRQLRGLLKNVRGGRLDPKAQIEVVAQGAAWAVPSHLHLPMPERILHWVCEIKTVQITWSRRSNRWDGAPCPCRWT